MNKESNAFLKGIINFLIAVSLGNTWATENEKPLVNQEKILINHVNVIALEGHSSRYFEDYSVLIENGKIKKISPALKIKAKNVLTVDGKGKFLLPGLIDAHVHIWDTPELSAYLGYGVTTVRNASGMPYHLSFAKDIESGHLIGPRLITTGPILNGQGPNTQINHQVVNTEQEARKAVREQHERGYRHLKVYSNLSLPAYNAILSEAQCLNMTIMGHTPEGIREAGIPHSKPFRISFTELLDDDFVSIEHMESIVWHGLSDKLDENKLRQLAKKIAKSGTSVTPTLLAHYNLVRVAQTEGGFLERSGVKMLNPFITEIEQESYDHWSKQNPQAREHFDKFYRRATKIFLEEEVTLLAGTDSGVFTNIPGVSLIDELKLMVDAGLTPLQALITATKNPASTLGLGSKLGQVKEGYIADLILVDKDPVQDISNLWLLSGVVVQGKWYDSEGISVLKKQAENTSYENSKHRIIEGLAAQGVRLQ